MQTLLNTHCTAQWHRCLCSCCPQSAALQLTSCRGLARSDGGCTHSATLCREAMSRSLVASAATHTNATLRQRAALVHRSRTRTPERERREREKQRGRGREGALQGHSRQLTGVAGCRGCKPRLQSLGRRSEHAHEFMGAFAARRARLVSSLRLLLLRAVPTNRHRPPAPGPATHRRLV